MFKLLLFFICLLFGTSLFAGVIKETKSTVKFKGLGEYSSVDKVFISGMQKREDNKSNFEGEGFMTDIATSVFLGDKDEGTLIKLEEGNIYNIDHEEEKYSVSKIEKVDFDSFGDYDGKKEKEIDEKDEDKESHSSRRKVIRTVFKVTDTGENDDINDFPCKKFTLLWVSEWEDTQTEKRGKDSLFTVVWTTGFTTEMKKAQQEEMDFQAEYMKKIGMPVDEMRDAILGTNWMGMFQQMGKNKQENTDFENARLVNEMKKIKGYPVLIDGNFFAILPEEEKKEEEDEESVDVTDVGGLFGSLVKKAVTEETEPKKDEGPAFSYYTEVIKFETADINPEDIKVPANYERTDQ